MTNRISEILERVTNARYTSASGPVLELCRELASSAQFDLLAESLQLWVNKFPHSEAFVRARLPAILINSHFVSLNILEFQQFFAWESAHNTWAKQISEAATSASRLPSVIASVEASMRQFASEHA